MGRYSPLLEVLLVVVLCWIECGRRQNLSNHRFSFEPLLKVVLYTLRNQFLIVIMKENG
jgi:hypothetical protein